MPLFTGRETEEGFEPSLFFRLFRGRRSGNAINGVGERERRRPTPVYHDRSRWHPWRIVQEGFYLRFALKGLWHYVTESEQIDRRTPLPIAPERIERTPEEWSRRVKERAAALGIDAVGIARLDPEWVFEGDTVPEPWVIVIASAMDFDRLNETTRRNFTTSATTVMETYNRGHRLAVDLADWIREQGWHAVGHGSPMRTPLNVIPAAIAAGLGELGKHGSMIHRRLGANFRLSYVATGLPLVADAPDDFGADDFCTSCQLCSRECPPGAIYDEKQLVRGVTKWYVDFDRCVPYFNDFMSCALCLAVCPWSRPGVADTLTEKMLRRRADGRSAGVR